MNDAPAAWTVLTPALDAVAAAAIPTAAETSACRRLNPKLPFESDLDSFIPFQGLRPTHGKAAESYWNSSGANSCRQRRHVKNSWAVRGDS